ncbi:alcohol dehydrogenase catalytic domain-containing protein [Parageobacillus sp. VR-IP]|uniref:zinc-dependent alcohol dehydrogenase n=1 Tax=Parageobacillus sp. VR-IP TaxID=2742205 RepID=UPI001581A35E|nr:alcohol dehydrogenase catalytic domain-containing protein [Parageobacillus sp. VR-IP]NUK31361.1 alcohol dehydrogenase catalytic domain-containing protein [Parageobacillus sp. VR-IP]
MKAVVKKHRGRGIDISDVDIPICKKDEVLVKVEAASICGSDLHMYEGMDAYEWVSTPVILGHEFAGTVVDVGNTENQYLLHKRVVINPYVPCGQCRNCKRGNTNLCDYGQNSINKTPAKSLRYGFRENGGMAEYAVVHYKNVLPIPDELSIDVAGMIEAIAIGVHAIERANILPGDTAVVIGPGPIGLSLVSSLSNYGLERLIVTGLRKDENRLRLAKELGATDIVYADEINDVEAISELTNGNGVDYVFETSGFHQSLISGVRMCIKGGEVLLVGISTRKTDLPSNEIVRGEVTVRGVYGVTEKTLQRTIVMAASSKYPYEKLISHLLPLERAVEGFEAGLKKEAVKVILKP